MTDTFDLDNELLIITQKNILPGKIVEKLGKKIKEKNLAITKEQLYDLVKRLQPVLQNYKKMNQKELQENEKQKMIQQQDPGFIDTNNANMNQLIESVRDLQRRIQTFENTQMMGIKQGTSQISKKNELNVPDSYYYDANMQPLAKIPTDPESIVITMKWLQYLVDKIGKTNLSDVLSYYVDIQWLTDDVRLDLIEYAKGITDEEHHAKEHYNLTTNNHIQSLIFIQKLKGKEVDERFILKINREMEKIEKTIQQKEG